MSETFSYGDFVFEVINSRECSLGTTNLDMSNGAVAKSALSGEVSIPNLAFNNETGRKYKVVETTKYSLRDSKITAIALPNTLRIIGWDSFYGTLIKQLLIPSSVEIIGYGGFSTIQSLETLIFEAGSKLKEIGERGIAACNKLKRIVLPPTVLVMNKSIFYGTNNQCSIEVIYCGSTKMESTIFGESSGSFVVYVANKYPSGAKFGTLNTNKLDESNNVCTPFYYYFRRRLYTCKKSNYISKLTYFNTVIIIS